MADNKIDRGLDEIIKERKITGRQPRGGATNRARGRGGFRRGTSANAAGNRSFGRRPNTGMVQKRRSAGSLNNSLSPKKALSTVGVNYQLVVFPLILIHSL